MEDVVSESCILCHFMQIILFCSLGNMLDFWVLVLIAGYRNQLIDSVDSHLLAKSYVCMIVMYFGKEHCPRDTRKQIMSL